jgi:hypothetical protein
VNELHILQGGLACLFPGPFQHGGGIVQGDYPAKTGCQYPQEGPITGTDLQGGVKPGQGRIVEDAGNRVCILFVAGDQVLLLAELSGVVPEKVSGVLLSLSVQGLQALLGGGRQADTVNGIEYTVLQRFQFRPLAQFAAAVENRVTLSS